MAGVDPAKWQALLKWTMKHTSDGTTPSPATPISADKRRFLEQVMAEAVLDENERVRDILRIARGEHPRHVFNSASPAAADSLSIDTNSANDANDTDDDDEALAQYREALLEELVTRVDQVDTAQNLCKMDGLTVLLHVLRTDARPSARARAAEVCAVVVQNNPFCQDAALAAGLLEALCAMARTDEDVTCRVKALLGISCLVRHCDAAETTFLSDTCNGLALLRDHVAMASDLRLQRKALFFLRYLIGSKRVTARAVLEMGFYVPSAAAFILHEDVDLCESAADGLAAFALLGPEFLAACTQPELDVVGKCDERLSRIDALALEERELAQETRDRVERLKKVLTA